MGSKSFLQRIPNWQGIIARQHCVRKRKMSKLEFDHLLKYPFDLGSYFRQVSATNDVARVWVNRGLIWSYGFNFEEGIRCFEEAILVDKKCPMAHWGIAFALGPHYNQPWELFEQQELEHKLARIHQALDKATEIIEYATPVESALISALQARYPRHGGTAFPAWNYDYARAMKSAYEDYSQDLDVVALYADAMLNISPWKLWNLEDGQPCSGAETLEIQRVISRAFKSNGGKEHPGLLHVHIHLMEMSKDPESAVPVADLLRGLVPGTQF